MKRPRELLMLTTMLAFISLLAPMLALGQTPTPGPLGNIKGVVFHDLNRNGIRDQNEPAIGGVPLRIESGDWNYSTLSAGDGSYEFCCLTPSTYYITASPLEGYNTTTLPLVIAVDGDFWTNQNIGLATAVTPTPVPGPYEWVTNTSGRPQPVLDGVTGQPVYIGAAPWQIAPGEAILSHRWGDSLRFVWEGRAYHYIGSVAGSTFRFFLVAEWGS